LFYIPCTEEEGVTVVEKFIETREKGYSIIEGRTCATAVTAGLKEIGVFENTTMFPMMVLRWFEKNLADKPGIKVLCTEIRVEVEDEDGFYDEFKKGGVRPPVVPQPETPELKQK
jgi:hypothetical protein